MLRYRKSQLIMQAETDRDMLRYRKRQLIMQAETGSVEDGARYYIGTGAGRDTGTDESRNR